MESLGRHSTEGAGGSTAINHSDLLHQDLPRSITPDPGTNGTEVTRTMASIPDVLRDEIDRRPLRPLPSRQTQTCNQSFSNLKSGQEIHDRINYIAAFAGLTIAHDDQHRLARLWSLLKDDRFAVAAAQRARGLFNWQCADLIEIFINITTIAPDRSHTIELINNVQDKTNDLAYYINKLSDLTETIQWNTKWTKKVYLGGAKPQMLSGEVIFSIKHFIADVENDYHGDCMMPYC
jgi:hypothetical protein